MKVVHNGLTESSVTGAGGNGLRWKKRLSHAVIAAEETQSLHRKCSAPQNPDSALWGIAYWGQTAGNGPYFDSWIKVDEQTLTMGRDSFGRVPLYWVQVQQVVWFASHFSLLLPIANAIEISIPALYGYSCFSYVPTPLTPIAGIFAIPTGGEQTWTFRNGAIAAPHWQRSLEWQESPLPLQDEPTAINQLQTLLKDAIQRQIADLNPGSRRCLSFRWARLFHCGGFAGAIWSEGSCLHTGFWQCRNFRAFLRTGDRRLSQNSPGAGRGNSPPNSASTDSHCSGVRPALWGWSDRSPLFLLGQVASQEVKVIFNGEGGDQLFAGWTNKPLIAASIYQTEHPSEQDFTQQYLRTFHRLWGYESQIFQPEVYAQIQQWYPQEWLKDALDPAFSRSLLHRLRRANLMLKGAQNIHPRATRLGLAHRLEVRSPFCDLSLAQWAFQVPSEFYLRGSCEKYILKRAVEPWLPPETVWRPKRGMGVPLTFWCFDGLWHEVGRWLNPQHLQQEGIWQPTLATRIVLGELGTIQGRRIGESLWLLLMWQVWRRAVLREPVPRLSWHPLFSLPPWLGRLYLRFHRSIESW
ncbi:asparagine synthase-related protein [Leptothermofonsia sp. ETS-13]|uniref:asparagine synthase-related protein n=1 Tax=Leptothermofonsia sp. ETS-13 TaxID=3035696 RepID=UPI003B9DF24D